MEPTGIEVLGTAQRQAWLERTLPPVESLGHGLWSVPVPIPDNPLRYTLSYLVTADDGLVVVDPGWDTDEGWEALLAGLTAAGAAVGDVTGIIATHVHPDHHGMSGRLREKSGAWIAMHPAEQDTLPQRQGRHEHTDPRAAAQDWMRRFGASDAERAEMTASFEGRKQMLEMPPADVLLEDGDLAPVKGRRLRAVWTPGHTPGHLCLQEPDARVLLTGDHVLPRITPNIALYPNSTGQPLARFLDSLDRTAGYDDHDALPAHEYRFRGLASRSRALREHHDKRCMEIISVVTEFGDPTPWQVARHLTWSRPWAEIGRMRFGAIAETTAHLQYLADQGILTWLRSDATEPVRIQRAEPVSQPA
ncbi:MAG TPA: MBL fold metallo-hydrolase [Amycolatopsis sp.]|nr:MBL fold metallo-hydrolase [Amycolatopsis sp.]